MPMQTQCGKCGRFISQDDCVEGIDWSQGNDIENGEVSWTGVFYCPPRKGCQKNKQEVLEMLEAVCQC